MLIASDSTKELDLKLPVSFENSGDFNDDEEIAFDYQPYNVTTDLKSKLSKRNWQINQVLEGVKYVTIIDDEIRMRSTQFRSNHWDPTSSSFDRYGKRYLKKSGIYEFKQLNSSATNAHYSYKVKMSSMIGPDHADQEQFHQVLINIAHRMVIKVTIKTQNFPYSETFNIEQM